MKIRLKKTKQNKGKTLVFVAADGSWGDAEGLEILELTEEQLTELNTMSESEHLDYLGDIDDDQSILFVEENS